MHPVFGLEQRGAVGDGDFKPSDGGGYLTEFYPKSVPRVHPSPPERCPQGSGAVLLKIEQSQLRLSALHS